MNQRLEDFNRLSEKDREQYLEASDRLAAELQALQWRQGNEKEKDKTIERLRSKERKIIRFLGFGCMVLVMLAAGCPPYSVWQQQLTGKAELARAEQNRQILINEAKAKQESAVHWAAAEVERAKGAAQANQIVADSLGGSEGYLRWLYIEKLGEIKNGQIIYLPTEAAIPILEAGKR